MVVNRGICKICNDSFFKNGLGYYEMVEHLRKAHPNELKKLDDIKFKISELKKEEKDTEDSLFTVQWGVIVKSKFLST